MPLICAAEVKSVCLKVVDGLLAGSNGYLLERIGTKDRACDQSLTQNFLNLPMPLKQYTGR
jgi:hypothetical protein